MSLFATFRCMQAVHDRLHGHAGLTWPFPRAEACRRGSSRTLAAERIQARQKEEFSFTMTLSALRSIRHHKRHAAFQ